MAQLKDTLIAGSVSVTDTLYAAKIQLPVLYAPTTNAGEIFGAGAAGDVLTTNGTSVYWGSINVTPQLNDCGGTLQINKGGTGITSTDPHKILIGPSGLSAGAPTWRVLDINDLPNINITSDSSQDTFALYFRASSYNKGSQSSITPEYSIKFLQTSSINSQEEETITALHSYIQVTNNGTSRSPRLGFNVYKDAANNTDNTYFYLAYDSDNSTSVSRTYTDAKIYGAVWNDYAEYRKTNNEVKAGQVVIDNDDGTVTITNSRLLPGAQVVSDTFGFAIGETKENQTPLAVSGRALVYTYQDRGKYHAGQAVCSAPNGTIDIMTREEITKYPDAIVGIVSEIPNYETWGTGNVPVNGRIWIKVR